MQDWGRLIDEAVDRVTEQMRLVRRYLHAHPEPSGGEFQTTLFLAQQLNDAGIATRIVANERGILAESNGRPQGPRVAVRADTDALRIHDEKEVSYRSIHDGLMHACGHDAHSSVVLGTALALHHCRDQLPWHVDWRAVFQPAEETSEGAIEMTEAGAVDDVRSIIALHVDPELSVGRVAFRAGPLTACCAGIDVEILGRGGHAARPHHTVDPISVAIQFVNSIYQFVPRTVDSREPVVVSFGLIEGGKNPNVIPERVRLSGTIRTLGQVSAGSVKEKIRRIGAGLAEASEAEIEITIRPGPDAVVNDPRVTEICVQAAREVVGADHVDAIRLPSMGGEDFSAYLTRVPGCMFRLGIAAESGPRQFLHSPQFDVDERALAIGAKILARTVVLESRPGA